MPKALPPQPHIDWLKKAAKEQLAALRMHDASPKLHQARLDRAIVPCSTAAARGRPASLPSRTATDIGAFVRAETARHLRGFHAANDRAGQGQTRSRMA